MATNGLIMGTCYERGYIVCNINKEIYTAYCNRLLD